MKYYDKRHTVEAMQWDGHNDGEVSRWVYNKLGGGISVCSQRTEGDESRLFIWTAGWRVIARAGDYVIMKGHIFETVPQGTFAKVYEEIG